LVIPDYFNEYRVVATNIAFACDPGDTSGSASYNILLDTDNDGVFDIVDFDDDNDGILDTVEGDVTDSNLDGRPDRISLDADGDGCADTIEAGFEDPDGDGILGTSPVTVDANGQVTGQGGYTTPNDLDNNGVFDFQEAGEPSAIENQPEEVEIALGDDAIFEVSATATFYQWQQSMDGGTTWTDLVNDAKFSGVTTDRLLISDARGRLEGSWYRVVLTSPDFACDPVTELISDGVRLVFNTELIPSGFSPNGDGENDLFSIPGLIETPGFTMEVFDRWGNSVYQYMNNGSLNPDWWDGRSTGNMTLSKGQLVPAGTYFYLIQYNDGNKSPDKGWVYVNY
jgi:gliding motility-associated-like protein